jgi:hypothetical protein
MRRSISFIAAIGMAFCLSGCFGAATTQKVFVGSALQSYQNSEQAIGLLHDYFAEDNTFTASEAKKANAAQSAITGMISRLQGRLIDGSVDYYYLTYFVEDVTAEYVILRDLMDAQAEICANAYVRALYYGTRADIETLLSSANTLIKQADADIDAANLSELEGYASKFIGKVGPLLSGGGVTDIVKGVL